MGAEHRTRNVRAIMQSGLSETKAGKLFDAGYFKAKLLREATDEQLLAIPGIGRGALKKIRDWAG